ncbi:MAG: EamA/RhaT family transporter [Pseudomonadota bacterium]
MLWAVLTITAAAAQTARNAAQRGLVASVGTLGATHARFLYGLPFALLFLAGLGLAGVQLEWPQGAAVGWAALGGVAQIGATALLIAAMRSSAFMLAVAYTKLEPVLVMAIAALAVGEVPTTGQGVAIVAATAGVLLMAWPAAATLSASRAAAVTPTGAGPAGETAIAEAWWRPLAYGLGSGALFALSAVAFRAAVLTFETPGFVAAAITTLALALAIQTVLFSAWLAATAPATLRALIARPRAALPAGFMGALASAFWFMAFALASAPLVRTLALVEILMSGIVGRRLFAETPSPRQIAGATLLVAGIAGLFLG